MKVNDANTEVIVKVNDIMIKRKKLLTIYNRLNNKLYEVQVEDMKGYKVNIDMDLFENKEYFTIKESILTQIIEYDKELQKFIPELN